MKQQLHCAYAMLTWTLNFPTWLYFMCNNNLSVCLKFENVFFLIFHVYSSSQKTQFEVQTLVREKTNSCKMVKTFQAYLPPSNRTYSCVHCRAHLASHDELISKVAEKYKFFVLFCFCFDLFHFIFFTTFERWKLIDWFELFHLQSFQGSQGRAYLFNSV